MAINKVVFGTTVLVDLSDSTVTPETLAEGVIAYNAAGERIVGTAQLAESTPTYTNLADPADSYWKEGYRLSISSGGTSACSGHTVTNFIPAVKGDILRIKGMSITTTVNSQDSKLVWYTTKDDTSSVAGGFYGTTANNSYCYANTVTVDGDVSTITLITANDGTTTSSIASAKYIRIDGVLMDGYSAEDVIITINEEIE